MSDEDRKNGRTTDGRTTGGRFGPGNPGRPTGSRHRATIAAAALLEGEAEVLARKAVDRALEGDAMALRLCLERLIPVARSRRMLLPELPDVATAADVPEALRALLGYVADGELSPDEAASIASVVEAGRKAIEMAELEQRLAAIERALKSTRR